MTKIFSFLFSLFFFSISFSSIFAQEPLDLRAGYQGLLDAVKNGGNLHTLPKGLVEGNLFSRAYKISENDFGSVIVNSLDATYDHLQTACKGVVSLPQVTRVFENTETGRKLYAYLKRRGESDALTDKDFADACVQVYLCAKGETSTNIKDRQKFYTLNTYEQCQRVVESIYQGIAMRGDVLRSLENINYGDDLFANGRLDDAPYDILHDIQTIGDILYGHNDPATEIHFYDVRPVGSYKRTDPLIEADYKQGVPKPSSENPLKHLPLTNGVSPAFPELSYEDYLKNQNQQFKGTDALGPQGNTNQDFPTPITVGSENSPVTAPVAGGGTLGNQMCEVPKNDPTPPRDILKDAKDEDKETQEYNNKLDLQDRVALDIFGGLIPDEDQALSPRERQKKKEDLDTMGGGAGGPNGGGLGGDNDLGAKVLQEMEVEGDDLTLDQTKKALQQCLEQSGLDKNSRRKQVLKTRGEAVKLSQCVQNVLCKGVHDPSGMGMYMISFCKIPSKRYEVVANMPVHTIEEVANELLNICSNLKESNLTKHTQTKDGIFTTQIANIKLGKMFSFEININKRASFDQIAPRDEKIQEEENNKYYKKTILNMSDSLTHESQRNKYIVIANPTEFTAGMQMAGNPEQQQQSLRKEENYVMALQPSNPNNQSSSSQPKLIAKTHDAFYEFIRQQYEMRDHIHSQMDELNGKWKAKYDEFAKGGKGK